MELFTFIPYFLLLEREESDRNTLANANTEFIREVYELQRVEKDVTLVFFQLQYLSCKLVILREHCLLYTSICLRIFFRPITRRGRRKEILRASLRLRLIWNIILWSCMNR